MGSALQDIVTDQMLTTWRARVSPGRTGFEGGPRKRPLGPQHQSSLSSPAILPFANRKHKTIKETPTQLSPP